MGDYIQEGYRYFAFNFEGEFLDAFRYDLRHHVIEKPFPAFFGVVYWEGNKVSEATLYEFEGNRAAQSKAPPIYRKGDLEALDGKVQKLFAKTL